MNRRGKIIVSITGIAIVSLFLIALTYGYYLTKILGNSNSKSITATSLKSVAKYTDLGDEQTILDIEPGFENIKLFTVQNVGESTANYHIYLDEVVNEFNRTQDITFTLYRKSGNNTIDTSNLSDSDIVANGTFPKTNAYILVNEKITTPGDYYTYALKINYIDSKIEDQTEDQGKTFSYKIQLHAEIINPYSKNTDTLAYNIINNAINVSSEQKSLGYAEFRATPITTPAEKINNETESELSTAPDDYGTSYYYRGNVKNNYLIFNNMCWRIVRIAGDGSIKLTLSAQKKCSEITNSDTGTAFIGTGEYGTSGNIFPDYETSGTSTMKTKFKEWFNSNLSSMSSKLKTTTVCIGDITNIYKSDGTLLSETYKQNALSNGNSFYYKNYLRVAYKNTTYMCDVNGTKTSETSIFPLTVDEVLYAGSILGGSNSKYFLYDNASSDNWATLSPASYNGSYGGGSIYVVWNDGAIGTFYASPLQVGSSNYSLRPSIVLVSGTTISGGDGSIGNAYTIK